MIPDWQKDCVFISEMLSDQHPDLAETLQELLVSHGVEVHLVAGTNQFWLRDFMPIQTSLNRYVKFRYAPDYLRDDPELTAMDESILEKINEYGSIRHSGIVLDGGNVVGASRTAILTDKIYKENPEWKREDLREELHKLLEVDNLIIIPKEPYDIFGHSDGAVRFVNESTVIMNDYSRVSPDYGNRVRKHLTRHHLDIELLPYSCENETRNGIPSAVGNYVNFLQLKQQIIVPAYGASDDDVALKDLERVFPRQTLVPLRCEQLAKDGGVLHCATFSLLKKNP